MTGLEKRSRSAELSKTIVTTNGTVSVPAMARTLGALVTEVLSGEVQASRAATAIRGLRTIVALADAVRRSSDAAAPMLTIEGEVVSSEVSSAPGAESGGA